MTLGNTRRDRWDHQDALTWRGIAKEGLPQVIFAVVSRMLSLAAVAGPAIMAGYDPGSAARLFAGSLTISASMGLATDAINRLGLPPDEARKLLVGMPIACAATYIFGTVGSAIILARIGPKLLSIDLVAACRDCERQLGAGEPGERHAEWQEFELRAISLPRCWPISPPISPRPPCRQKDCLTPTDQQQKPS